MFTPKRDKEPNGSKAINLDAIANVRGEKFDQNLALAGFNGKNIVLTGMYFEKTSIIGNRQIPWVALECIYFEGENPENGKIGTISSGALKSSIRTKLEGDLEPIIENFRELSERDCLEVLMQGNNYLRCEQTLTVLKPTFKTDEKGNTTADYSEGKTKKGYKYVLASLPQTETASQPTTAEAQQA